MKFFYICSLVAAAAAIDPQGKQPGWWYRVDNAPSEGFEIVTSTIKVDPNTHKGAGYYAANSHLFQDESFYYFGLQPFESGNGVYYLVFGEHTEIVDSTRCRNGADGGSGISCHMIYPWKMGVEYTFELKVTKKFDDGRRLWNGTLIEPSGERVYIASWIVGKEKGNMSGRNAQWLEWWPYNGDGKETETRECQPYGKAYFKTPRYGQTAARISSQIPNHIIDKCALAANTPNTRGGKFDGGVWVESGFLKNEGSTTLKTSSTQKSSTLATKQTTESKPQSTEADPNGVFEGNIGDFGNWLSGLFN